jgi:beta-lactamase superfamily II metal-dependent hydrolase
MTRIPPVASSRLHAEDFVRTTDADDLLYFALNVGDGDTQLLVLPEARDRQRRVVVVDVADHRKLDRLLSSLADSGLVTRQGDRISLVVATHPHNDHIRGMPAFLGLHAEEIREFWDPGFLAETSAFNEMMVALEELSIRRRRPTAGYVAVIDNVRVTVLTPNVRLRQLFVTHGVDENNSSLTLRVEFPAARVTRTGGGPRLIDARQTSSLILGADAQFEAWAHATVDFPELRARGDARRKAMKALLDPDVLRAQVFKVPHHGSKHGVSLELAERMRAEISVVSCIDGPTRHEFPHEIARASLREARGSGMAMPPGDDELGIHYTGGADTFGRPLGTICVRMRRGLREVWRFCDGRDDDVELHRAVRWG